MKKKTIVLVGRPNVGKSTLFNRLSASKKAIVHDRPGVTRDRKYADGQIGHIEFVIIDTPGLEEATFGQLEHRMMLQTTQAILEADIVCLIIDGRDGVTPTDKFFANFIRKHDKSKLLIVNKCEKKFNPDQEYYKLGFGEPVAISAAHNIGMMELFEAIDERFSSLEQIPFNRPLVKEEISISLAIAGKPNAGKSTFINAILNENRLLTGPEAGITRESIEINWSYKGHNLKLIDTAGLRRKNVIKDHLEKLSASDSINSINFANIVVLMIDSQNPLEQQDLNIANYIIDQGRALVIAVNKWDLVEDKEAFKEEFNYKLSKNLAQVNGVSVVYISAINKQHLTKVLDQCILVYDLWNKKISTSKLNEWIGFVTEKHPLPLQKSGRRTRIKYVTQTKTRPPTFKFFCNNSKLIPESYQKYLINGLRESFDLPGVPIRLTFTQSKNPYLQE